MLKYLSLLFKSPNAHVFLSFRLTLLFFFNFYETTIIPPKLPGSPYFHLVKLQTNKNLSKSLPFWSASEVNRKPPSSESESELKSSYMIISVRDFLLQAEIWILICGNIKFTERKLFFPNDLFPLSLSKLKMKVGYNIFTVN